MKNTIPFSPFKDDSIMLPQDRKEINAWARHYYATHPIISTFIDEITAQVYSDFTISSKDAKLKDLAKVRKNFILSNGQFKYAIEAQDIIKEINLIGEAIPYMEIGDGEINLIIQNPDYIELRNDIYKNNNLYLIPDQELIKTINSSKPEDVALVGKIDSEVLSYVKSGNNIPLHQNYVSYFAIKGNPFDIRGTSRIVKYFKILLGDDREGERAFEKGESIQPKRTLKNSIKRECRTKAFEKSLIKQREDLQEWIINKLIKSYCKVSGIKGTFNIHWNDKIDISSFEKMWSK